MFESQQVQQQALRLIQLVCLFSCLGYPSSSVSAQEASESLETSAKAKIATSFHRQLKPFFDEYCIHCHDADSMESGIRLDVLEPHFADSQLYLWKDLKKQIESGAMPPEDELAPSESDRNSIVETIQAGLDFAASRKVENNGVIRRLTVSQYKNTLQDLLGLKDDLTDILPPDGVSKDGFLNDAAVLSMSPLQLEYYFEIAEKALDICIVDSDAKPSVQHFEVRLGDGVNPDPFPDKLILGANNHLLENKDFVVRELATPKNFDYVPFRMRTKYRFIEGYEGNSTVRGWREYDSIYHSVFACMRGTSGYDLGEAYELGPKGLLLRPAIPSAEIWQQESTYGPRANFKISLRELPSSGNFRVRVRASKYRDAMLLDSSPRHPSEDPGQVLQSVASQTVPHKAEEDGAAFDVKDLNPGAIYLVGLQLHRIARDSKEKPKQLPKAAKLSLKVDGIQVARTIQLQQANKKDDTDVEPMLVDFAVFRTTGDTAAVSVTTDKHVSVTDLHLLELESESELAKRFVRFEKRNPLVGVHVGLRRDCGSTMKPVESPKEVSNASPVEFTFEGAINNYPRPYVEVDNVNYLAGVREIGVRHEYTDGRETPRLRIHSVEFEGPFYDTWPPKQHSNIFIEPGSSPPKSAAHATRILKNFLQKAFRRPATNEEVADSLAVWQTAIDSGENFESSIKDALLVTLTSPQFLFLAEQSQSSEPEPLNEFELASKLSYFLWDRAPDAELLQLAENNSLHSQIDNQTNRLLESPNFAYFVEQFVSQWLSLDKFDVVEINAKLYPRLTRDTRTELRKEPVEFMNYLWQENLPLSSVLKSDFILANEVVANYYGLEEETESRFGFVPVKHGRADLGGILSQASILAGLSDGNESNPVKRGAWFARKMIAEPPDPPPPNVPDIGEIDPSLPLRKRLELHRNQPGCANCHAGIDPYGVPFEEFDAAGLMKEDTDKSETTSLLPDGVEVHGVQGLKNHLLEAAFPKFRYSFAKHLMTYAIGRQLTFREDQALLDQLNSLTTTDIKMRDLLHLVVHSDAFMMK